MVRRSPPGARAIVTRSALGAAALCVVLAAVARSQQVAGRESPVEVTARKATATERPTLPEPPAACPIPMEHHAWARFTPGAWRRVRIITESYNDAGEAVTRSETRQKETLVAVDDDSYTIETENIVSVGGKTLQGVTQRFTRRLLTDGTAELHSVQQLAPQTVVVGGQSVACDRWEASVGEGEQRRLITVFHASEAPPYVMRRELVAADGSSARDVTNETMRVERLDMPVLLGSEMVSAQSVRVRSVHGSNSTERTEVRASVVPGGLVRASSTERNASGRRVRWSVEELEEYGSGRARDRLHRWRLFHRPW